MEFNLPHDISAEAAVIGTIFAYPELAVTIADKLNAEHFFISQNKAIINAIIEVIFANNIPDVVNIKNKLREKNEVDRLGVFELRQFLDSSTNMRIIHEHLKIIEDFWISRQAINICERILFHSKSKNGPRLLEIMREQLENIKVKSTDSGPIEAPEVFLEAEKELLDMLQNGQKCRLSTSFRSLDQITTGYHKGEVTIIGARPGMGKTAFATNLIWDASFVQQKVTMIFTLEMSRTQLINRVSSSLSKINSKKFRNGGFTKEEIESYEKTRELVLQNRNLIFDHSETTNVSEILAKCKQEKKRKGSLDLVVIDYLQLVKTALNKKNSTRELEVAEMSRSLKAMARNLECPVVLLAQLNRSVETRPDKRPGMADIRESGSVEQDADVVLFLYRDEYYNKESTDAGLCEVIISKNRHGETGTVKLVFEPQYGKFSEIVKL